MSELVLRIFSFSYKSGIPLAEGSHGGGFIFDLRCLPNPGREARFKDMTGVDDAVVSWLEAEPEVLSYRTHAVALVEQAVRKYLERGFDSLQIGFGCTGGQHRSVYFAQYLTHHLATSFPVRVVTEHIEQFRTGRLA